MTLTVAMEGRIYQAQDAFIEEHFGPDVNYNPGWCVDEVEGAISTKVYGHGILTSWLDGEEDEDVMHQFEPFS